MEHSSYKNKGHNRDTTKLILSIKNVQHQVLNIFDFLFSISYKLLTIECPHFSPANEKVIFCSFGSKRAILNL